MHWYVGLHAGPVWPGRPFVGFEASLFTQLYNPFTPIIHNLIGYRYSNTSRVGCSEQTDSIWACVITFQQVNFDICLNRQMQCISQVHVRRFPVLPAAAALWWTIHILLHEYGSPSLQSCPLSPMVIMDYSSASKFEWYYLMAIMKYFLATTPFTFCYIPSWLPWMTPVGVKNVTLYHNCRRICRDLATLLAERQSIACNCHVS